MRSPCCATGNIVRHDTVDHFRMEDLIEDIIGKGSNARFQYISRDEEILPGADAARGGSWLAREPEPHQL